MAQANIFPYLEFKFEQLETDFRKLKSLGSYTSHSAWNVKDCSAIVDIFLGWQQTSPSLVADDNSDCTGSISDFWRETHCLSLYSVTIARIDECLNILVCQIHIVWLTAIVRVT